MQEKPQEEQDINQIILSSEQNKENVILQISLSVILTSLKYTGSNGVLQQEAHEALRREWAQVKTILDKKLG